MRSTINKKDTLLPQLDGAVPAARCETAGFLGMPRHTNGNLVMTFQLSHTAPRVPVPHPHPTPPIPRGKEPAIRGEGKLAGIAQGFMARKVTTLTDKLVWCQLVCHDDIIKGLQCENVILDCQAWEWMAKLGPAGLVLEQECHNPRHASSCHPSN